MIIVLDDAYRPGVKARFDGHEVRYFPSSIKDAGALADAIRDAEVVGFRRVLPFPFTRDIVSGAHNLKYIHRSGSGADWFHVDYLSSLGILVAVNSGFNAPSVAEHAVLMTLLLLRRSLDYFDEMRAGGWPRDLPGSPVFMLSGRTVGVIGVGAVGGRVAKAMLGLNARVLCYQRDRDITLPAGAEWAELDTILREADVVTLHVPLVPDTHHLIDASALGLMKPTAILINTSRGPVVDQPALLEALQAGRIRGAGLDVFEEEPLPADHPFRTMPNVLTSPHVGGAGVEIAQMQVEGTLSNIDRYVAGRVPERLVNAGVLRSDARRAKHLVP